MKIERGIASWTNLELRLLEILQEYGANEMLQPNCVEEIIKAVEELAIITPA